MAQLVYVAFTPRHITQNKMAVYLLKKIFLMCKRPSLLRITPRTLNVLL